MPATTGGLQDTEPRRSRAKTGLSGARIILPEPKCNRIVALIEEAARAPLPGTHFRLTLEIGAPRIQYALRLLPRQRQRPNRRIHKNVHARFRLRSCL